MIDSLRGEFEARPLLVVFLALCVGLCCGFSPWHALYLAPMLLLSHRRRTWVLLAASFALGFWLRPAPSEPIVQRIPFNGEVEVTSVPFETRFGLAATGQTDFGMVVLDLPKGSDVSMGDRVAIVGRLSPVREGSRTPHGTVARLRPTESIEVVREGWALWRVGNAIRRSFHDFVGRSMPAESAALVDALCFNYTAGLDSAKWDELRRTGTIHIVSASGLHVLVLAGALALLLRLLPIPRPWQMAVLILLLVVYGAAAGWRAPMIRAILMASVALLPYLMRREADGLSAVALAGILGLLWSPETIADLGFLLSFVSVVALVMFAGDWSGDREESQWNAWLPGVQETARASLIATAATAPVLALTFGEVSVVAVLSNVLIAPAVAVIVPSALVAWVGAEVFPPLSNLLVSIIVLPLTGWMTLVVENLARWPIAAIGVPAFSPYFVPLLYGVAVLAWRPRVRKA